MKEFIVTGTSGKQIRIMGPDNATQEDAQASYDKYQQQRWYNAQQQQRLQTYDPRKIALREAYESMGPVEKFGLGAAKSAIETYEGGKQLLGLEGPETARRLHEASAIPLDMYSGPGYLTGEIAQTAIPAGAAIRGINVTRGGASLIPPVPPVPLAAAAPVTTEATIAALQGGLKGVEEGPSIGGIDPVQQRLLNAGLGGASAMVGFAPGGVRRIPEAENLVQRAQQAGVPMRLTPGQSGGAVIRGIEQKSEAIPIVGSAFRQHQRTGLEDWNRLILNEVAPEAGITEIGSAGIRSLRDQFNRGYEDVISRVPERLGINRDQFYHIARLPDRHPALTNEQRTAFTAETDNLLTRLGSGDIPREDFKHTKGEIASLQQAAMNRGEYRLSMAYRDLGDAFNDLVKNYLSPDDVARLEDLDRRYQDFMVLLRAHAMKGVEHEGVLTPSQLKSAIRADDPSDLKRQFAYGSRPLQAQTTAAEESLGRTIPAMGPGSAEKLGQTLGAAGFVFEPATTATAATLAGLGAAATYPLAPLLRGLNPVQREIDRVLRVAPPGTVSQTVESIIQGAFQ